MNPLTYQKNVRKLERTSPTWSRFDHASAGASSEAGELADMVKKHHTTGKEIDPYKVLEECGDLLWYVTLALDAYGWNLYQAMSTNIAKLKRRREHGKDPEAEREIFESYAPLLDQFDYSENDE